MEDYKGSARRHLESAIQLQKLNQIDNAGHLIGIAVECALKFKCNLVRNDFSNGKGHLPKLIPVAIRKLQGRNDTNLLPALSKAGIMQNWTIDDRYCKTGKTSQQQLAVWFTDAKEIISKSGVLK